MVFLFGVFHGTEEIVCRVSFEYNLVPLLKEEKKEEDFKVANDRAFRMAEFYREVKPSHQLRRPAAVNRARETVCGMQAKEAGCP